MSSLRPQRAQAGAEVGGAGEHAAAELELREAGDAEQRPAADDEAADPQPRQRRPTNSGIRSLTAKMPAAAVTRRNRRAAAPPYSGCRAPSSHTPATRTTASHSWTSRGGRALRAGDRRVERGCRGGPRRRPGRATARPTRTAAARAQRHGRASGGTSAPATILRRASSSEAHRIALDRAINHVARPGPMIAVEGLAADREPGGAREPDPRAARRIAGLVGARDGDCEDDCDEPEQRHQHAGVEDDASDRRPAAHRPRKAGASRRGGSGRAQLSTATRRARAAGARGRRCPRRRAVGRCVNKDAPIDSTSGHAIGRSGASVRVRSSARRATAGPSSGFKRARMKASGAASAACIDRRSSAPRVETAARQRARASACSSACAPRRGRALRRRRARRAGQSGERRSWSSFSTQVRRMASRAASLSKRARARRVGAGWSPATRRRRRRPLRAPCRRGSAGRTGSARRPASAR